jgi:DNA replication and repair protein RecF
MILSRLAAREFRVFGAAALEPDPTFNLITGDNGAGKTSLLEALYVLGRGASYRAAASVLARDGGGRWSVEGVIAGSGGAPSDRVRVSWDAADSAGGIYLRDTRIGAVELVRALPMQIVEPGMHRLVEEGPAIRRKFLDWGVFHVEQRFFPSWQRMRKALRQRNEILRGNGSSATLAAWSREFAETAEAVTEMRNQHLQVLQGVIDRLFAVLVPEMQCELRFLRGWSADKSLLQVLDETLDRDRKYAQTTSGPQRAELSIAAAGRGARGRISRGQQKMLVASFVLAQCEIVGEALGSMPALLFDDFAAELSGTFQRRLLDALCVYTGQKFVSTLDWSPLFAGLGRVFHVEHNQVHALVE